MSQGDSDHGPLIILLMLIGLIVGSVFYLGSSGWLEREKSDDRAILDEIQSTLSGADAYKIHWNNAERSKDEVKRVQYIRLAKPEYEKVIALIDALRKEPYATENGDEFHKGYEFLDDFASRAGLALLDIVRRSRVGDFDEK